MTVTGMMRIAMIVGLMSAALTTAQAGREIYSTSFEAAQGYNAGSINGVDGWVVEGPAGSVAEVVNNASIAQQGSQYVALRNGAILDRSFAAVSDLDNQSSVWVEGYFRGAGSDVTLAQADYPAMDASAIVHFSQANGIELLNGARSATNPGTPVSAGVALNANQWYKISIRLNFATQSWDVWVNNVQRNTTPLGFKSPNITRLRGFKNLAQNDSFFDRFRVVLPVAGDSNGDAKVDAADMIALIENLANGNSDVIALTNGDIDGTPGLSQGDVTALRNKILKR